MLPCETVAPLFSTASSPIESRVSFINQMIFQPFHGAYHCYHLSHPQYVLAVLPRRYFLLRSQYRYHLLLAAPLSTAAPSTMTTDDCLIRCSGGKGKDALSHHARNA
jgi:hypothetical protein